MMKIMRRVTLFIIFIIICFFSSCSDDKQIVNTSNNQPTAAITNPANGSSFSEGELITFSGTGTDPEDGTLTESSLVWTSDKDGQIGTGITFNTSSLSVNTHTITLTVTDSDGISDTVNIIIYVTSKDQTGTMTNIDGNVYETVKLGNQWWMAANLKVTHYSNGDDIQHVTNNTDWTGLMTGAYCNYDNNSDNADTYGSLYNWYAVNDSRNIAPEGWHVPTDEDWTELIMYLDMRKSLANSTYTNSENGFFVLPSGYRTSSNGSFAGLGSSAYFWSSTENNNSESWSRRFYLLFSKVYRESYDKRSGFSVRLVGD